MMTKKEGLDDPLENFGVDRCQSQFLFLSLSKSDHDVAALL